MDTVNNATVGSLCFSDASADAVRELVTRYGRPDDLKSSWNNGPAMEDMLAFAVEFPQMTFQGTIERSAGEPDWVSVQGFEVTGLSEDQESVLLVKCQGAGKMEAGADPHGGKGMRRVFIAWY